MRKVVFLLLCLFPLSALATGFTTDSSGNTTGGTLVLGSTSLTSGVTLDMGSDTDSLLLPTGTSVQRPTGVAGMLRYNSTITGIEAYYSGGWNTLGTGTIASIATTSPISGGTIIQSGTISCPTCATTTNGGAMSATSPVAISAGGAISITGVAGQVLAGSSPAFTATPTLGVNGTTTGQLVLANGGTSGTSVTIQNNGATSAYNFNLPTTAGSSGTIFTSGGGGSSANTWTSVTGSGNVVESASPTLTGTVTGASSTWSGSVGIGTTSPTYILSLGGGSAQTFWMERGTSTGNNLTVQAGGAVSGGTDKSGGNLILASGISTGTGTSNIQFSTYPAGSTGTSDNTALTALTFSATGTSGSNAITTLQANAGSGTNKNGGNLTLASGVSTGIGTSSINFNVYGAGSSGSTANSATTAMTITSAGSVGIGTSSPNETLEVNGPAIIGGSLYNSDQGGSIELGCSLPYINCQNPTAGAEPYIDFHYGTGTSQDFNIRIQNTANNQFQIIPSSGIAVLTVNAGSVGIGTVSPRGGSTLDVNGELYVGTFASSSSTTVCQNGNVLSTCSSAIRFKENIRPATPGLKEVLKMKPVTFDFRDHKDNWEKHDFGFIAEDMEKINPLFVTYDKEGRVDGVRYMQLAAVNAKAIQELYEIIQKQGEEIRKLKQSVGHSTDEH